ncbi:MAG: prepilin peptidase [Bacilli bacterium]
MNVLIVIFIGIIGLLFGSFLCCMGYRIPNKISTISPGSFCPTCKKPLKWYMNIPLFSYIFLKGKCAYCKTKINIMYPLIELTTSILFIISYLVFGFSYEFIISIVLSSMLCITLVTDFKYYYISDRVLIISFIVILIVFYFFLGIKGLLLRILYGIILFIIMYIFKLIGDKIFKRESLGGGDIKLMGVIGFILGLIPSVFVLFISSVLALIFSLIFLKLDKTKEIPFGPFILIASLIMFYFGTPILTIFKLI